VLAGLLAATTVSAVDHFQCYSAVEVTRPAPPALPNLLLADDIAAGTHRVLKAAALCGPALVSGGTVADPATHLQAYRVRPTTRTLPRRNIRIANRFGETFINANRADRVLLPAALDPESGPGEGVDAYTCYKARPARGQPRFAAIPGVLVNDGFGERTVELTKPTRLCAPASLNGGPIQDPAAHLLCYRVRAVPRHTAQRGMAVTTEYGSGSIDTRRDEELCVPSIKDPSCLSRTGPLVTLTGTYTAGYNGNLSPAGKVDANTATFVAGPTNRYPINLDGGDAACFAGGVVDGRYNRSLGWEAMHDMNNAGIAFDNAEFTLESLRIDNVTDGIRPQEHGGFTLRRLWLSYIRDDCVENDHVHGGLIEDVLFDGCYVGIAARPSQAIINEGFDGRNQVLTIRGALIRLEPMPYPRNGSPSDFGHGALFKWDNLSPQLALHDNIFMAEQTAEEGPSAMAIPSRLVSCTNNVMVWLGSGPYPAPLPSCFTMTRDRSVWDNAVADWRARHADVGD
jgi:hypothetical protein